MLSTRRSLFGLGKLAVAAALVLVPAIVHAQAAAPDAATNVTLTAVEHDKLLVQWQYTQGTHTAESFEVGYSQQASATDFIGIAPTVKGADGGATALSYVLTGLTPGKRYLVGVRAVNSTDQTATPPTTEVDPALKSDWAYANENTGPPPKPGDVDDRDITVMAGDMELVLTWDRHPTPGASGLEISGYMIEYSPKKDFSSEKMMIEVGAVNMAVIANLMNDMTYYIRMKAKNDAGGMSANWSETLMGTPMAGAMPTPTPALPVFGAFALGVGLLAAGRARLRRRAQLQQCREQARLID